jgi:hypothetical protein
MAGACITVSAKGVISMPRCLVMTAVFINCILPFSFLWTSPVFEKDILEQVSQVILSCVI